MPWYRLNFFLIFFFFPSISLFAQWTQTSGPNGGMTIKIIHLNDYTFINGYYGGVFRSEDKINWQAVNGEAFGDFPWCANIATDGNRLFSAIYRKGVFYSDDYGITWHLLHDDFSVTDALVIVTIFILAAGMGCTIQVTMAKIGSILMGQIELVL